MSWLWVGASCTYSTGSPASPSPLGGPKPLGLHQSRELVGEMTANWFYGQGLGDTAVKAGAVVAFPPFAILLLGNAALNLSGYGSVGVSKVLPSEAGQVWRSFYDTVTSAPGHFTAALSGREFRREEISAEKTAKYLNRDGALPSEYRAF
jgi:hypothetical protein